MKVMQHVFAMLPGAFYTIWAEKKVSQLGSLW